ncbi:hypothetical protein GJA_2779 [Janthinobacterium agaricidamnosum NBRC 102515 = DSM 9628]|uniref:Uncharacterized protein n=1 Tax=Janthinobacterium agaricidamnosum NBRC 102515 = DSM 9628 TaxID=1349767 RepID=W0V731_9BURK|nr:hypothetical protein GJA_2779 [Janthinobacterium agaricidamnosum NBRC 102515 = DSM 9628]
MESQSTAELPLHGYKYYHKEIETSCYRAVYTVANIITPA